MRIPAGVADTEVQAGSHTVRLTNLDKLFWSDPAITKRDLLQYYADISAALLPHLKNRAMVMKRYPNGAAGEFFFMKRAPSPPRLDPDLYHRASIGKRHRLPRGRQDLASLLWVVNLGCIDLNPWYATCDDVDRPDYLHFDLDPVPDAGFDRVLETALIVRDALASSA